MKRYLVFALIIVSLFSCVACSYLQELNTNGIMKTVVPEGQAHVTITEEPQTSIEELIWSYIQQPVSNLLVEPGSAEFIDYTEAVIKRTSDTTYHVLGEVNCSNRMGVFSMWAFELDVYIAGADEFTHGNIAAISQDTYNNLKKLAAEEDRRSVSNEPFLTPLQIRKKQRDYDLIIKETKIIPRDDLQSAFGDMLNFIIYNYGNSAIKNITLLVAAWDKNGLPIQIERSPSVSQGEYIQSCNLSGINLTPRSQFGYDADNEVYYGFYIQERQNIKTLEAIILTYETYDGTRWENPDVADFYKLYYGMKHPG